MPVNGLNKYLTQGAMEGFMELIAPVNAFAYAVRPGVSSVNDVVRVPFAANTSASLAFAYSTGYATDGNLISAKPVTLDTLYYQKISLTDSDLALLTPDALTRIGRQAGARLAADVISQSLATVATEANFGASGSMGGSSLSASSGLAAIDRAANDRKWPQDGRNLICGTAAWQALMQNTTVLNASSFGSIGPVQQGQLSTVIGFTPYKVTFALPNNDTALIVNNNAIVMGLGYHAPQDAGSAYTDVQQIVDEKSGITIGFRQYYDAAKATNMRVFDCLFGAAVGNTNALYHLKG